MCPPVNQTELWLNFSDLKNENKTYLPSFRFVFSLAREKTKGWERKKGNFTFSFFNFKWNWDNINKKI
jgi:hypothetical protein